jgi:hypothetical protein
MTWAFPLGFRLGAVPSREMCPLDQDSRGWCKPSEVCTSAQPKSLRQKAAFRLTSLPFGGNPHQGTSLHFTWPCRPKSARRPLNSLIRPSATCFRTKRGRRQINCAFSPPLNGSRRPTGRMREHMNASNKSYPHGQILPPISHPRHLD